MVDGAAVKVVERLKELLERLDQDPVGTLREQGIKGTRWNALECPVARYLQAGVDWQITVGLNKVYARHDGEVEEVEEDEMGVSFTVPIPNKVSSFITHFDVGDYPDMEIPDPDSLTIEELFDV